MNSDYTLMKKKNIYILLLLAPVLFASCKVGKSYVRPEMALPDSLMQQQDSISIADEQWQAVYTDNTLRNLIARALEYNKDMLVAAARVKEMAAQKRISVANLLPQLNGKIEAEREVENYGGHSRDVGNSYEAKALLSWELDLWGNLRWKKVAAVADYLQSVESQRALRMTIVAEVAQAYYELVALDTELEIVRQTQKAREEGVRLARIRFEGGLTSETSYQQAQVELARTATLVPDLERKISIKENDIAFLAGEFPTRIERSRFLEELDVPESLPVGLPSGLLERRPDIRAAEQQLIAEHARVKVAYTNMFPRLSLTGQFGLESDVLSNFLQSPYSLLNGAVLTPLFNWGKNRAALKAQKASFEAEVHSYEKTVRSAFKEVNDSLDAISRYGEQLSELQEQETVAQETLRIAQNRYRNGYSSYLDVLDAQRTLFSTQLSVVQVKNNLLLAQIDLYRALGGGWSDSSGS